MFNFTWGDGQGGVPAGAYPGILKGIEPQPPNEEKGWGPGVKFVFEITQGEHKGKTPTRIVSGNRPTPKNNLGKMLVAMLGGTPKAGEQTDPMAFVGKPFHLIVAATTQGGTRVETVAPLG